MINKKKDKKEAQKIALFQGAKVNLNFEKTGEII